MSLLHDFAEEMKAKRVPIQAYYADEGGKYAFRVVIDDEPFVCVARSSQGYRDKASIMQKVAGEAQSIDAKVLLRLRDRRLVFDPVAILHTGDVDDPVEAERKERGEQWVEFPIEIGCPLDEYVDGYSSPMRVTELSAF